MARRLNKKVLVVVLGVLVAGGGAVLGTKLLGRGAIDGKKLEAQGDAAFAKADYNEALLDYRRAQGAVPSACVGD